MVQFSKNLQKNAAIDLRKKGLSYAEIKREILVPKSTLSTWLKKIKLSESQIQKLKNRRLKIARDNSQKKILITSQKIEEIKNSSAKDLKKISKRELWLMGVVLYWRERLLHNNESDLRKGVRFTSSDPSIIKFFLKWLQDIGQLEKEEIGFDIFLINGKVAAEAIDYWSQITDLPKDYFPRVYFQKNRRKRTKKKSSKRAHHGLLRVRIKASSMLARQISGWVKSIVDEIDKH
ncbi:MAG: hypothetical protein HYT61_00325 [Candidatus Yanofskybacteria bacterium]|nr:hypothetical protein [Candidatus Yanofskybacteria bacterium]